MLRDASKRLQIICVVLFVTLAFTWIGVCILVSYAMYIPVILFVQQVPTIGMLMIPKTMAYVGIALIAYFSLFRQTAGQATAKPAYQDT